ncbi:MAG TPA: L,D-transpeptidase, partial [Burkholderiales bacterium]
MRPCLVVAAALTLAVTVASMAEPFWGAKSSRPAETDPSALKPGEFIWAGDEAPSGPIVVVVSLPEQRAYVYRNGIRIGVSTTSTGKPGHGTPTGVFTVLQKDRHHHSKTYNNAAMPDTERLTWDGVALHAGGLPGYPSSHGCVHLPSQFAALLFDASNVGMTVVIADEHRAPADVVHPAALAPVDPATGKEVASPALGAAEVFRWQPEKAPDGPLSIVISGADRRMLVYRNGVEIGRAKIMLRQPDVPLGTHAFIMLEGQGKGASPVAGGRPAHR